MRVLILVAGILLGMTATATAYCRCECWRVPGGRVCQKVCTPPPRAYVPPQTYSYAPPVHHDPQPSIPPEIVGLGIIAVLAAVIAAIVSAASGHSTAREIAQIEGATLDTRAQAQDAEQRTHAISSYIASEEAAAFERGRRAAEREWEEYSRYE
jgi:hypothetical protein